MAGFQISKPYTMPREQLRTAAEGLAEQLAREHGMRCRWQGDCVRIRGAGFDGELDMHGDTVDVSVKLGLLTSMFKDVLQGEVQRYLDEHVY